jgi:hypothetical protein
MCVRKANVTPREKKKMVTNKLWDGANPELLPETKEMDAADELVFLNRELRRLIALCDEYRKEITDYKEMVGDYREFLYDLRKTVKSMGWSPLASEVVRAIEIVLDAEERKLLRWR